MTLRAQTPSLRARQASSTDVRNARDSARFTVDTALTRARQARLPSPWTGRGIWRSRERENASRGLVILNAARGLACSFRFAPLVCSLRLGFASVRFA